MFFTRRHILTRRMLGEKDPRLSLPTTVMMTNLLVAQSCPRRHEPLILSRIRPFGTRHAGVRREAGHFGARLETAEKRIETLQTQLIGLVDAKNRTANIVIDQLSDTAAVILVFSRIIIGTYIWGPNNV